MSKLLVLFQKKIMACGLPVDQNIGNKISINISIDSFCHRHHFFSRPLIVDNAAAVAIPIISIFFSC